MTDAYVSLITSEHADKDKFIAAVRASVAPFADSQAQLANFLPSFDLDSAVGAQLDVIGLWVGASRNVATPLTGVYFEFDNPLLGWDEGFWKGRFDPDEGLTSLDDDHYRALIRAKIAANHWDGTLPSADAILAQLLEGSTVYIQDNQDMTMTVGVVGAPLDVVLRALLTGGYLTLKPEAVRIDAYLVPSVPATPLFGFDVENSLISGFDTGSWGVPA